MTDLWVFGYGSLMWRPGFPYVEQRLARLAGAHRALCVYSWVHRGTEQRPGLVLGLDRGGTCRGIAFRVAAAERDAVIAYLREREQVTSVYLERERPIRFADGTQSVALAYLVDRRHPQYAGMLDEETRFRLVADAEGRSGRNREYVISTAEHLAALGIPDAALSRLALRLAASAAASA